MVELVITNQQLIKQMINRTTCKLTIKFNNKRAFFKTNEMNKYKPIAIERIRNLTQ